MLVRQILPAHQTTDPAQVEYTLDVDQLQKEVKDGSVGVGIDIKWIGGWHNIWGCSYDLCRGPFPGLHCPLSDQFELKGIINVPHCSPPGHYRFMLTLDSSDPSKEIVCGSVEFVVNGYNQQM